jgi:hypothetical protein
MILGNLATAQPLSLQYYLHQLLDLANAESVQVNLD